MRRPKRLAANHTLLDELTALAAELEADAAATPFRFGASRAYDEIVHCACRRSASARSAGFTTWSAFLARRMAPAMRTCSTMEQRHADLSDQARARRRSVAHARRRRAAAAEPRPAALDEPPHAVAAAPAGDRRGPVGRGDQLLRGRAVRPPDEGRARGRHCRSTPSSQRRCSCRSRCCRSGGWCAASGAGTSMPRSD